MRDRPNPGQERRSLLGQSLSHEPGAQKLQQEWPAGPRSKWAGREGDAGPSSTQGLGGQDMGEANLRPILARTVLGFSFESANEGLKASDHVALQRSDAGLERASLLHLKPSSVSKAASWGN